MNISFRKKRNINLLRCQEMAGNCGMCLSLDPKYQCGWCEVQSFIHSFILFFNVQYTAVFNFMSAPTHVYYLD